MAALPTDVQSIKDCLGVFPDFPQKGIVFLDIFPIITHFLSHIFTTHGTKKIDVIVGLDARGFLLGPILASRLGCAFVPIRKKGKLPGECLQASYEKEYGVDTFEIQKGAIKANQTVLCIDDLVATGGSCKAAGELVEKCGGIIEEYLFVIDIQIGGKDKLNAPSYAVINA